jgi:hypothetical protein
LVRDADRLISTRTDAGRNAHHLSHGAVDLVAVEHETGLEVLLFSVGSGLAVDALSRSPRLGMVRE